MNETDFSAELAALQAAGWAQRDPIGFQHMGLLAQRLPGQPEAVQHILAGRLREAIAQAHRVLAQAPVSAPAAPAKASQAPRSASWPSPLAGLNQHIQRLQGGGSDPVQPQPQAHARDQAKSLGTGAPRNALKSLDRFRDTWAKVAADAQLQQALARAPDNAGPLNSHLLVLRTLSTLNALSPEHLHGVMAQLDALLWLEQATQKPTAKPAARRGRTAK